MVTLADSLVSSSARVLPVRMRPDLTAKQQRYLGQLYWVVKEPVGLQYFRFQEEEYAILKMLDGRTSLDEVKVEFERRFPPEKVTVEELGHFVGMLHRSGLVVTDSMGQGEQLLKRRKKRALRSFAAGFANILALRFKGIDPQGILDWLHPKFRWMFSWTAQIVFGILALSALSLVMVQFDTFRAKLPTFHEFFEAKNWIYMALVLGVTKVIHEFGHGLSCKHFGGECHEMGVMFLVLTPCLYCNVSDSWMLPNKYHRAIIGAAGMYIEIVMASVATFLWWFSAPGLLNQICLSIMFICSVSTVLFNANPLLRFDGYYILSDLMEIPNLRQKATTITNRKLAKWCLGLEEPDDPFLPQRNQMFFAFYTVAAVIYRWVILFGILFFLYKLFEPYGLKIISQMLAMVSIGSLVVMPIYKIGKFFYVPGRLHQVKRKNVNITLAVLGAATLFILFCPLPYRVICPLEIKPRDADPVYVDVPGVLEQIDVKPWQTVKAGDQLGLLKSTELDLEIAGLQAKLEEQRIEAQVLLLQKERFEEGSEMAGQQLPEVEKSIQSLEEQLAKKIEDRGHLRLIARSAGTVLPPPETPNKQPSGGALRQWSGSPLESKNLGAHLAGTLFCQIGNPTQWEANLVIDQDDIEFVTENQPVAIKLDELPSHTFQSKIAEIGPEMKFASRQLSSQGGGDVMSKADESGAERPINTSYQASAPIDDNNGQLVQGLRGTAKVYAKWQPIGKRVWRYLMRTFNFTL
ncbi:MAG: biotin/lipoyl-binding protein [Pirellulales bacterium]